MPIITDPLREAIELEEERRRVEERAENHKRTQEHEYRLAKLKYSIQPRYKSVERVVVTLTKSIALPIAICTIGLLVILNKEVPESLEKFITI